MLLNKGEAILCNSRSEALELAKRLSEEGYEMFTSRWGSIAGVVGAHIGKSRTVTLVFAGCTNMNTRSASLS